MDKQELFKAMRENWGSGMAISPAWILLGAGLVLMVVAVLSFRHWWRTRHERPTPLLTFLSLAEKLGLTRGEQWLLIRVASQQKLSSPIALLLSAGTLAAHGRAFAGRYSTTRSKMLMQRVRNISDKLFGNQP
ncbi:MAG: hypothetical protein IT445_09805 [Phycisphaeraceae bacterium]|nr:hypothetical protein [Phycisphaeraceae bacterium]